ncbi:MAG: multifunctional CCA addition/repair protein [Steroidobacteraceae bacterium]|jgi:tRNA nucleotidyltransferase (CCA-adding enzyme)|nr:multifunctional CCA addition/repair protein [Steroidobacteraceae bacterium]
MRTYLVGGAIRDALLGRPVKERDWVVVGARPEDLEARGFRAVGRDFPVFLHPGTHEEHALARVERKTGPGYRGFAVHFAPDVTLEEDLRRRDLTINAMAQDEHGALVDPYGGRADLDARLLRHVSEAFAEDPVRILRVARFAARYAPLGFTVAADTLALMRRMVDAGEADALVPERVWAETVKALGEDRPTVFFEVLRACGALAVVFPELDRLWGVPQPAKWHPEIDTGVHVMMVLEQAAKLSPLARVRFAALTHDLGKGETHPDRWPAHHGHEERSVRLVDAMAERLRVPTEFRDLARAVARWHGLCHRTLELRPSTLVELLENLDAFRRPERFAEFLLACEADIRGRTGLEERPYPQAAFLARVREAAAAVVLTAEERAGLAGPAIGERIRRARVAAIAALERPAPAG